MNLDINGLAARTWKLFTEKPVEHVLAGFAFTVLLIISLGILAGPLTVGWIRMCEKQRRGEVIQFGDFFSGFDTFLSSLGGMIVMGIGIVIGFALLVLPGFVLLFAWYFAFYFIALRGQGAFQAIGSSWRLFRARLSPVLTAVLLVILVSMIGAASMILGLVTMPLSMIFTNLVFAELSPEERPV